MRIKRIIEDFWADESAQSAVEYALLALILVAASYGVVRLFQNAWQVKFDKIKRVRGGFGGMLLP
jgi:hypothetical protein